MDHLPISGYGLPPLFSERRIREHLSDLRACPPEISGIYDDPSLRLHGGVAAGHFTSHTLSLFLLNTPYFLFFAFASKPSHSLLGKNFLPAYARFSYPRSFDSHS